jgi:16S rRNA (guanine527-N7)-methyltransferase
VKAPNPSQFDQLFSFLAEANQRMNLTAIRNPETMRLQHGEDSLALFHHAPHLLENATSLLDIGTGAGFPLLPLALTRPDLRCLGVDSVAKKLVFVRDAAQMLGLTEVQTDSRRAEQLGRDPLHREAHGLVTSRAVGPVAALLEVSLPLTRVGGAVVLYKTESALVQARQFNAVAELLGGEAQNPVTYRLTGDLQKRILLIYLKVRPTTKKFPRGNGIPFHKLLAPR